MIEKDGTTRWKNDRKLGRGRAPAGIYVTATWLQKTASSMSFIRNHLAQRSVQEQDMNDSRSSTENWVQGTTK